MNAAGRVRRDAWIGRLFAKGVPVREIAARYRLAPERVRGILAARGDRPKRPLAGDAIWGLPEADRRNKIIEKAAAGARAARLAMSMEGRSI